MITVTPFAPKPRVVFYGEKGRIDVTPADMLRASVSLSLDGVAMWDLLLTGRNIGNRSYIGSIKSMDYVEIEMARVPSQRGELTVVLRGFVDNVSESLTAGARRVSVNGRNFGKLLLQFEVYYMTEIDPAASLNPQARLEQNFGIPAGVLTPKQFVQLIGDKIVKPNLANLQAANPKIPDLQYFVEVPDRFAVNGFVIQPFTGSVINLLNQYASKPWIETFVTELTSGPAFVYRFAPFKTFAGEAVANYGQPALSYEISLGDIESISAGTSDNEVRNYYFTYPTYSLLDRDAFKGEGLDLKRNPYVDPVRLKRYGFRPLEIGTTLIPSLAGDGADLGATAKPETIDMAGELNQWLWKAYTDNDRFYNGSITMNGGAGLRPGMYLEIRELKRAYYVTSVVHNFDVSAGRFQTSAGLTRGRDL